MLGVYRVRWLPSFAPYTSRGDIGWRFLCKPKTRAHSARVVVLYVGKRDTRRRRSDVWEVLHDLFEVENPPDEHDRPPCCEDSIPDISEAELDDFLQRLRRVQRRR